MAVKKCLYCGTKFVSKTQKSKYCSPDCRKKDYKIKNKSEIFKHNFNISKYTCRWCGKEFEANIPRCFCTSDCANAHRAKRKSNNKENMKAIANINELARKEGLTYGQYFAKYGY